MVRNGCKIIDYMTDTIQNIEILINHVIKINVN